MERGDRVIGIDNLNGKYDLYSSNVLALLLSKLALMLMPDDLLSWELDE